MSHIQTHSQNSKKSLRKNSKRKLVLPLVILGLFLLLSGGVALAIKKLSQKSVDTRSYASSTVPTPVSAQKLGRFGQALAVGDGGGVFVAANNNLDLFSPRNRGGFTLEAWVKPDARTFATFSGPHIIATKEMNWGYGGYALMIEDGYPKFQFRLQSSIDSPREVIRVLQAKHKLQPNRWYHLAIMRLLGNFYILVNGQLEAGPLAVRNANIGHYKDVPNEGLIIGAANSSSWRANPLKKPIFKDQFYGKIDELRISNTFRRSLIDHPPLAPYQPDGNTVALWHFDGNLLDASGKHNDAWPRYNFVASNVNYQPPIALTPTSVPATPTSVVAKPTPTPKNLPPVPPTPTLKPSVNDIHGLVFKDLNGNGRQDRGEEGVAATISVIEHDKVCSNLSCSGRLDPKADAVCPTSGILFGKPGAAWTVKCVNKTVNTYPKSIIPGYYVVYSNFKPSGWFNGQRAFVIRSYEVTASPKAKSWPAGWTLPKKTHETVFRQSKQVKQELNFPLVRAR